MTYILDLSSDRISIDADMLEWHQKYLPTGIDPAIAYANSLIVDAWRSGTRALLSEEMPRVLVAAKTRKSWPDIFKAVNGLLVVRGPFKDIMETLDPEQHQFWPITRRISGG